MNEIVFGNTLPGSFSILSMFSVDKAPDEEAVGFKMGYMLLYHLGLRGTIEPEVLHSKWNDAKRSLRNACMMGCVLKGTVMTNLSHGFFLGGKNHQQKEEVLEHLSRAMEY